MNNVSMSQTCLYNISYKKATRYIYNSYYRGHLALVQHKPSFATVHSRVTVGGSSVECEYKLLPQFARLHAPPWVSYALPVQASQQETV